MVKRTAVSAGEAGTFYAARTGCCPGRCGGRHGGNGVRERSQGTESGSGGERERAGESGRERERAGESGGERERAGESGRERGRGKREGRGVLSTPRALHRYRMRRALMWSAGGRGGWGDCGQRGWPPGRVAESAVRWVTSRGGMVPLSWNPPYYSIVPIRIPQDFNALCPWVGRGNTRIISRRLSGRMTTAGGTWGGTVPRFVLAFASPAGCGPGNASLIDGLSRVACA